MGPDHLPLGALLAVAGVVGLFVGSFLNVVVYRTPLGLSVSQPRSFCPTCDRQLHWWETVPVLSWLALRGRCHTCHQPISIRYPLVEVSTAVSFVLVTWAWHGTGVAAGYCVLAAGMISVGLIEYSGQRAPLSVAAISTGMGAVIIVVAAGWLHHWSTVAGCVIGSLAALALFAGLRTADPECVDQRGHGRSALLIAGAWTGGLGPVPVAVGAITWILAYFCCMAGAWATARRYAATADAPGPVPPLTPILAVPLVSALGVALVASLIARG